MLKDITIGQYYPTSSAIHKLDPRIKLVATIVFMVSIFVVNKFWPYIVVLLCLLAMIKLANIPVKYIVKGVKPLKWIILFTFLINIFYYISIDSLILLINILLLNGYANVNQYHILHP